MIWRGMSGSGAPTGTIKRIISPAPKRILPALRTVRAVSSGAAASAVTATFAAPSAPTIIPRTNIPFWASAAPGILKLDPHIKMRCLDSGNQRLGGSNIMTPRIKMIKLSCPKCGSKNTKYSRAGGGSLVLVGLFISIIGIMLLPFIPKMHICKVCGYTWK